MNYLLFKLTNSIIGSNVVLICWHKLQCSWTYNLPVVYGNAVTSLLNGTLGTCNCKYTVNSVSVVYLMCTQS